MVRTEWLSEENQAVVEQKKDGLPKYSWIRFWNEEKVQLDGDFSVAELRHLVAIMESFESNV